MNGRRRIGKWISRAGDIPIVGDLLYRLNVNQPVVRMMARGHVYSDPNWLTGERLTEKMAVISAPGARFASVRFVTGMLDLLQDRSSFLETARRVKNPILVIYGAETPRRSKAEIEALKAVPNVELVQLQQGKLAIHEEFPDVLVNVVRSFLGRWTH
jgi:pimeloyl-ACP methyl ester carboxylesterase